MRSYIVTFDLLDLTLLLSRVASVEGAGWQRRQSFQSSRLAFKVVQGVWFIISAHLARGLPQERFQPLSEGLKSEMILAGSLSGRQIP